MQGSPVSERAIPVAIFETEPGDFFFFSYRHIIVWHNAWWYHFVVCGIIAKCVIPLQSVWKINDPDDYILYYDNVR